MTKDQPNGITAAELREQTALGVENFTHLYDFAPIAYYSLNNITSQAEDGTTMRLRMPLTDIYQENPDD